MAMQLGGDDLLAKPFDLQVLSAKVQALLRRAYDFGPSSHLLSCGAAVLNVSDGTLDAHGQRVELTRNEVPDSAAPAGAQGGDRSAGTH